MAPIPSGIFVPLYKENPARDPARRQSATPRTEPVAKPVPVAEFLLDVHAVTNRNFLNFVRTDPRWRRSSVKRIFADANYLKHWKSDLDIGDEQIELSPVTHVSWFAAKAYCEALGKELPTVAEWELAAAAPPGNGAARNAYKELLLDWYGKPTPERLPHVGSTFENRHGVCDLHGLVWEWTMDFNSALMMEDARGDGGGDSKLFCGGGAAAATDFSDYAAFMRYAFRSSLRGNYTVANLGFRCAKRKDGH